MSGGIARAGSIHEAPIIRIELSIRSWISLSSEFRLLLFHNETCI